MKTLVTYKGWRVAMNAIGKTYPNGTVTYDGDQDIATCHVEWSRYSVNRMMHYRTCIGEWDGQDGYIIPLLSRTDVNM